MNLRLAVGFLLVISIVFLGVFAPWIALYPTDMGLFPRDQKPSLSHLLGTDSIGRDIFSMLVHGITATLMVGAMAGSLSTMVGVVTGFVAAYKGGLVAELLRRLIDIFLVIPVLPLLIVLSGTLARQNVTYFTLALIIAIFGWPGAARNIQSLVLSLKKREFVDLAKLSNERDPEILFKEIMPNMLSYIGATFGMQVGAAMVTETALSLMGLGPSNANTMGIMLYWTRQFAAITRGMWWWFLPPALVLIIFFIGLQLLNMGLDEVFNPRLKRVTGE